MGSVVVNANRWPSRRFTRTVGIGAALAAGVLKRQPACVLVNRPGAGGLAPRSNGAFLVAIIRRLGLDKKYGLASDINLYSGPSALYTDIAAERTNDILGAHCKISSRIRCAF
jgi:hypothetical protein